MPTSQHQLTSRIAKLSLPALVAIMLISTLFLAACSDNNQAIKDTITDYFSSYSNQEFSHCLELYSHHLRLNEGDKNIIQWLQHQREWDGAFTLKSVGTPEINKTTATVWVDFETEPFKAVYSWQIYLVKEDGEWKIDNFWELP